jgi:hypothetical protein
MTKPSVEDVERITAIADPVIRNLNITQSYYELSKAMSDFTGTYPNWCTFAAWASKQAGQSIRKEDLIRAFKYYFRHSPEVDSLTEILVKNIPVISSLPELKSVKDFILQFSDPDAVFEKTAEAVAAGNKKVFEEIGREFARFLADFKSKDDFTPETIKKFCDALLPGNPPYGQQLLKDAFTAYYEALLIDDQKAKAEMIFYANLLIGFHEQTRLQPEIAEALNAPLSNTDDLRSGLLKKLLPGFWLRIRYYISKLLGRKMPLDEVINQLSELMQKQMREVITRFMMSLNIPESAVLRLGKNLTADFPPVLKQITNTKLNVLLSKIDPTPDSLEESGAKDWGDFEDRIHFIADFFRAYHEHRPLYNSPFTDTQVTALKAGQKPSGEL